MSWAAGFAWDGSGNADASSFRVSGPKDNRGAVFQGTAAFTTSNKFQVRKFATGQYDLLVPNGTSWDDWSILDFGYETGGGTPQNAFGIERTNSTTTRIFVFRTDTGALLDAACAISIGRIQDI